MHCMHIPWSHPAGRAAFVRDDVRPQVILYGGANQDGPLGDAWVCNLDSRAWQDMKCQTDRSCKSWHTTEHVTTGGGGHYLVVYGGEFSVSQQASFGNELAIQVQSQAAACASLPFILQACSWLPGMDKRAVLLCPCKPGITTLLLQGCRVWKRPANTQDLRKAPRVDLLA